jgi:uncharacterized protein (DUF2164 family)
MMLGQYGNLITDFMSKELGIRYLVFGVNKNRQIIKRPPGVMTPGVQ